MAIFLGTLTTDSLLTIANRLRFAFFATEINIFFSEERATVMLVMETLVCLLTDF